ncbi:hypothetical protein Scep_025628 [Stephania cephalantha]|uniref:Uncharacterized protein n=1 Tax=Stephania cephalantha TaxID=152367 RepID=A0AAP0EJ21_9MAGN
MSKAAPRHEQGRALARQGIPWQGPTNLDLGVDPVKGILSFVVGNTMVPLFDLNEPVDSLVDLGYDDGTEIVGANGQVKDGDEAARTDSVHDKVKVESEITDECQISLTEPNIIIAQDEDEENEIKIEVISERLEKSQKQSKEDQHLVLVKPPTLTCIFVESYKGLNVRERSQIFYSVDTFVLDDHDATKKRGSVANQRHTWSVLICPTRQAAVVVDLLQIDDDRIVADLHAKQNRDVADLSLNRDRSRIDRYFFVDQNHDRLVLTPSREAIHESQMIPETRQGGAEATSGAEESAEQANGKRRQATAAGPMAGKGSWRRPVWRAAESLVRARRRDDDREGDQRRRTGAAEWADHGAAEPR